MVGLPTLSWPRCSRAILVVVCALLFSSHSWPHIYIDGNASLENIDGLSGLSHVRVLSIRSNSALQNINGLVNLVRTSGALQIYDNSSLSDCKALAPLIGWPRGGSDAVGGSLNIYSNAVGCNDQQDILDSVLGPTKPVITTASPLKGVYGAYNTWFLSLYFDPAIALEDIFPITGYHAECSSTEVNASEAPGVLLQDSKPVTRDLEVVGSSAGSIGASFSASIEVDINITHSDPTDLYISLTSPQGTKVLLWNQGSPGSENLVGTFPSTLAPVESLNVLEEEQIGGTWTLQVEDVGGAVGSIVREGTLNGWGLRVSETGTFNGGTSSPFTIPGVGLGGEYGCSLAVVSKLGTTPVSDTFTYAMPNYPSAPTFSRLDYGNGEIFLYVSISNDGGRPVSSYTATCTDGTNTFTGTSTSSPITVSGLTNDVAYTCTVTATNSVGTSSASAATDPITPEETATGLPIWLLYQATQ